MRFPLKSMGGLHQEQQSLPEDIPAEGICFEFTSVEAGRQQMWCPSRELFSLCNTFPSLLPSKHLAQNSFTLVKFRSRFKMFAVYFLVVGFSLTDVMTSVY